VDRQCQPNIALNFNNSFFIQNFKFDTATLRNRRSSQPLSSAAEHPFALSRRSGVLGANPGKASCEPATLQAALWPTFQLSDQHGCMYRDDLQGGWKHPPGIAANAYGSAECRHVDFIGLGTYLTYPSGCRP